MMEDHDVSQSKMSESAQRVVDRAIEESRRRNHALLTNTHIFLAFAQVEPDLFSQVMREVNLDPDLIRRDIEAHLDPLPPLAGREQRVAPGTKLLFKLAFHHAGRAGRGSIQSIDLFSAIFEESQGIPVSIVRQHGVEPEDLISGLRQSAAVRAFEVRQEQLEKERAVAEDADPMRYRPWRYRFEDGSQRVFSAPIQPRSLRERLLSLFGLRSRRRE